MQRLMHILVKPGGNVVDSAGFRLNRYKSIMYRCGAGDIILMKSLHNIKSLSSCGAYYGIEMANISDVGDPSRRSGC